MNSPAARSNAARPSRPALMRELLANEADCECGARPVVRRFVAFGRYESLCLDCATGLDMEAHLAELHAMLDSIHV